MLKILTGLITATTLSLFLSQPAAASTISLEFDAFTVGQPSTFKSFDVTFLFGDQLNGTPLNGQSVSLDFIFSNSMLARVLQSESFRAHLTLNTNTGAFPGFFGAQSTGFLLSPTIESLLGSYDVGRASGNNGQLAIGLYPQLSTFDISGVHYDLVMPNNGAQVTGGSLRLLSDGHGSIQLGTVAQVPDNNTTIVLLGIGFLICASAHRRAGYGT